MYNSILKKLEGKTGEEIEKKIKISTEKISKLENLKKNKIKGYSMLLKTIIKKIESKYPLNLAYDWDNVGLLVGDFDMNVEKVLVVLEANEKVIDEAIENNIDLIITHHPFIFKKMNKINTMDLKGKLIHKLIKNDITLFILCIQILI